MQASILLLIALAAVSANANSVGGPDNGAPTGPAPSIPSSPVEQYQQELLNLVNNHRARIGAQPLCLTSGLIVSSQKHSNDMARGKFMSHTGSDGTDPFQRMRQVGYAGFQGAAENVAFGSTGGSLRYETPAAVFKGWMDSPGHRTNIENKSFNQMGGARAVGACPGSGYGQCAYWTQNFGKQDTGRFPCIGSGYGSAPAPAPQPPKVPAPAPVQPPRVIPTVAPAPKPVQPAPVQPVQPAPQPQPTKAPTPPSGGGYVQPPVSSAIPTNVVVPTPAPVNPGYGGPAPTQPAKRKIRKCKPRTRSAAPVSQGGYGGY
ncbi:CAP domain-containing protein [Catenaria anguillulae PL171]|uniref:CAP domain-containing protein n=1 Tax=Catenaria anguillulae PL171 TaxID=765915 RepID=A0A1Y2HYU3_9FUNG|nr:CAP domain-containing protein [Catenaria anguillulae PL171]